jgi:hypothetical protein
MNGHSSDITRQRTAMICGHRLKNLLAIAVEWDFSTAVTAETVEILVTG